LNISLDDNRQLLSDCLAGDRKASETLVRRFSALVYQAVQYTLIAKQVSFSRHDIEDLHNTVFLRLFDQKCKKLGQYQGKNGCSLTSWIRLIAVRTVLDHLRKKGLDSIAWQKKCIPLEELHELQSDELGIEAQIDKVEQARLVQSEIEKLPPRDKMFIKLHIDQGLSVATVAETMHLSIQNAYTIKHRAIQRLKWRVVSLINERH
jgi:RNA polymerase sigma factor (sigma-70 family)